MHWSLEKAKEIIENNPNVEEFVCASGISPSGHIHIGNFRELITTYYVVKGIQQLGKQARFIFSWDDFDRLRKVPKNINPSYEKYLGLPYSAIPDPYGCCQSYAKHFENEFENAIKDFCIDVEFIYQTEAYKSGKYNLEILHALSNRKEIYDIVMSYKTQAATEVEREKYFPINLYCHDCGKDLTTIERFDEVTHELAYYCECGYQETMDVSQADNIKLVWKVDWPMRWKWENVIFEPGGRDHSSVGGSFEVSSRIASEIFDFKAPDYIAYEFIGIKGNNGKMSSSNGNLITPSDLLKIYIPEIILFIFSKYHPSAGFKFGFDDEVIRNYKEYERFRKQFINGKLDPEDDVYTSLNLADLSRNIDNYVSYSKLAGLLPLLAYDRNAVRKVLIGNEANLSLEGIDELSDKIEYWIRNWHSERSISVNEIANMVLLESLTEIELKWLREFKEVIIDSDEKTNDEVMEAIYSITRSNNKKDTKKHQQQFFRLIYQLLINKERGPRLALLVRIIGVDKVLALIKV